MKPRTGNGAEEQIQGKPEGDLHIEGDDEPETSAIIGPRVFTRGRSRSKRGNRREQAERDDEPTYPRMEKQDNRIGIEHGSAGHGPRSTTRNGRFGGIDPLFGQFDDPRMFTNIVQKPLRIDGIFHGIGAQ